MHDLDRILVVDSTGRGHSIAEALRRTAPRCEVHYGPGNPFATAERLVVADAVRLDDPGSAVDYCQRNGIGMALVTNLDAICAGTVDALKAAGIKALGATREASGLEADKDFSRSFCQRNGIPGPSSSVFTDSDAAKAYVRERDHPVVVKAAGLCENGDGAHVCDDENDAFRAIDAMLIDRIHGAAGETLVVEERLFGTEISMFALFDVNGGFMMFPPALDYKRFGDGDTGGNCDGMGSIYPHPYDSAALRHEIEQNIFRPIARGFAKEGIEFTGFLFVGGMLTSSGIKVLEINVRFGDSEAQVVFPSLEDNLLQIISMGFEGRLGDRRGRFLPDSRCCIVLAQGATEGFPGWPLGAFETGHQIHGIDEARRIGCDVFLGRVGNSGGRPVTAGGRVLNVVGSGDTLADAVQMAYHGAGLIQFEGLTCRKDVGSSFSGSRRMAMAGSIAS
ncbi:MAG: phosphoribosylamine--glycine ligase [Alphaproteobacteria bacterium]|jgi:phosphoribosylamine---glycine ligase|nr:phosphoribosylamine--glycine ligase [Alphaproteobacteria bacterium]MBU1550112.1 phosphoribosylamine--glycine ligase [Alphaproteobacteria bacterium]MBU2337086.1 phosphoribosylamine--glycine ligase [Alphaproteobacteria bacterium]MBU2389417.1 phosphoribosylamine--glycine ligase [Alphaproteobacteria bacterium]